MQKQSENNYLEAFDNSDFSKVEDNHFWYFGRLLMIKKLLSVLSERICHNFRVIEIGCGAGGMLRILGKKFKSVKGYDTYEPAVKFCKARGSDASFLQAGEHVPEKNGSIDLICSFDVFEHVEDDMSMFRECHDLLKNNGHLLLTVPAKMKLWSPFDDYDKHYRRYEKDELREKMKNAGFEIVRISYFMFLLYPLVRLNRILMKYKGTVPQELFEVNPIINAILKLVVYTESCFFGRCSFPVGSSLICLARKP